MNSQFGLQTKSGWWLPRDAHRRGNGERFLNPDLWQDEERANELGKKYGCTVVMFAITELTVGV
jgi:hypothetical protein